MAQSFTAACKAFFGFKEDQKISDFAAELRELSHAEKLELAAGMRAAGIDCEDPATPAQ